MELDEAIKHCEEKAKENKIKAEEFNNEGLTTSSENYRLCCFEDYVKCSQCAEEHEQLAEWLEDYKRLLEERPQGEWIINPHSMIMKCPLCGHEENAKDVGVINPDKHFCYFCGARMKGGEEE